VVVVSGLKVVLIVGLVSAVARVFEWSRGRTLLVALPAVGAYVLISGAGPAAIRSAFMAGAAMLAATGARRTDPIPMLALAAAIMLGLNPQLIEDPGFQLSFLGTAGILLLARPIAARLPGPRLVAEPFAVTIAAQVATVPIMAGTFGVISLGGPIANALVLPILPVMIVTGGTGAILSTLNPAFGWVLLQLTGLGTSAVTTVAQVTAAIPGATVQVGNWPVAWTITEAAGIVTGLVTLAVLTHRTAPLR
jgi:competence protein ComEC